MSILAGVRRSFISILSVPIMLELQVLYNHLVGGDNLKIGQEPWPRNWKGTLFLALMALPMQFFVNWLAGRTPWWDM